MASTTNRIFAGIGACGALGAAFVLREFNPTNAGFFPQCPFHALTGLNCPGCGLTRAFHSFLNFDIVPAFQFNLTFPVYLLIGLYLGLSLSLYALRGRGLQFPNISTKLVWTFMAFVVVFTIVRNIPVYPFNILAI